MDLFHTGSGVTLLAFQEPERLVETLGCWGMTGVEETLTELRPVLARIRREGYRAEASSQVIGITDLSVPVLGPSGDAVAAVTCAYLEHPGSARPECLDATLARLVDLGNSLSLKATQE